MGELIEEINPGEFPAVTLKPFFDRKPGESGMLIVNE